MKLTNDKQLFMPDSELWHRWGASYEKDKFKKCMEYTDEKPKRIALDIGAHIGIWSRRLSNLYEHVHCFEPVSDAIECHKRNTSTITNTTLHEHALGSREETLEMKVIVGRGGTNSFHFNSKRSNKKAVESSADGEKTYKAKMYEHKLIPIEVKSLDSYNFSNVDFMKIDIESHELEMLKGAVETLERCNPIIFIEDPTYFYNKKNNKSKPTGLDFLIDLGYKVGDDGYLGTYNYLAIR